MYFFALSCHVFSCIFFSLILLVNHWHTSMSLPSSVLSDFSLMKFGIVYNMWIEIVLTFSWCCFPISPCSSFSPLFSSPLLSFPSPTSFPFLLQLLLSLFLPLSISLQKHTFSVSSNKVVVSNWDSWLLTSEVCYTGKSWIIRRKGLLELLYFKNTFVCDLFVLHRTTCL